MPGEPHSFPLLIRRAREHCGLSLSEAAELIPCTKSHLWDLERGRSNNPSIFILAGLACAYDLDLGLLATSAAAACPGTTYRTAVIEKRKADLRLVAVRAASEIDR